MKKKLPYFSYWFVVLFVYNLSFGQAPAKKTIAVLDLNTREVMSSVEANTLTDRLRMMLTQTGVFKVLEHGEMLQTMQQADIQKTDCNTVKCAVDLGILLNVDLIVMGSFGKLGSLFTIDLAVIDVETSQILKAINQNQKGGIEGLIDLMQPIANQIANVKETAPKPVLKPQPQETGVLNILSQPTSAEIFLNNKNMGKTPLKIEDIATGEYTLKLTTEGYAPSEIKIMIEKGKTLDYKINLKKIFTLKINSVPVGAQVNINDSMAGKTPYRQEIIEGSRIVIKIEKENYIDWAKTKTIKKDTEITAKMKFTREYERKLSDKKQKTIAKDAKKSRKWLWIGGGTLVVSGIVAAIMLRGDDEPKSEPTGFPAPVGRPN